MGNTLGISMLKLHEYNPLPHKGLLFVGDPHVWSFKPGRRRDNYLEAICYKLEQIAEISNTRGLWTVILGDLFHHAQDNDLAMISRLTRIFSMFDRKPIVLVGNHDLTEHFLTPGTTLDVFHSSGQILTIVENGPFAEMIMKNGSDGKKEKEHRVIIGGTPYGEDVPKSLSPWFGGTTHASIKKKAGADTVVWITHDDFAFDQSYPNAKELKPILGCDIAVNGHMHRKQRPLRQGETSWYNPGNISRLTVDLLDQDVAVWAWAPDMGEEPSGNDLLVPKLEKITLKAQEAHTVMSLEGRIAQHSKTQLKSPGNNNESDNDNAAATSSRFVEQLKNEQNVEKTDEAVFLREALDSAFTEKETPEHVVTIINSLFQKAVREHQEKKSS